MHRHSWRIALIAALALSAPACKQQSEKEASAAAASSALTARAEPPKPAPSAAQAPAAAQAPSGEVLVDVGGLKVARVEEGRIALTGKDKWGAPLDTTYESAAFFKSAVPVLERAVSPEQAAALKQAAEKLAQAR